MSENIEDLFNCIENADKKDYTSLLFNIYEDEEYYTIEASFDDDYFVIGRDNPFTLCDKNTPWQTVEKDVGLVVDSWIKKNKEAYKQFKSISYGFVDGDLHYIRKPRKKKKEIVHFTSDDFKDFPSHKLTSRLAVYLTEEAKEKYKMNMLGLMFNELSEEQHKYWREILAENFDYDKYGN
jgi:hypothetical protein